MNGGIKRECGSGSIQVFIMLFFLSVIMVSLSRELSQSFNIEYKISGNKAIHRELENECRQVVEVLSGKSSSEVDSPDDYIWEYINSRQKNGLFLSMEDISSKIAADVKPEIFEDGDWPVEYYTSYCWINELLNDVDEDYPLLNNMPLFNIYYTEPDILEEIFSHPYKNKVLKDWKEKFNELIDMSENRSLNESSLAVILDEKKEREEYYLSYLGVTTWFWRIKAEKDGFSHVMIIARLPIENDREKTLTQKGVYQIVQSYRTIIKR